MELMVSRVDSNWSESRFQLIEKTGLEWSLKLILSTRLPAFYYSSILVHYLTVRSVTACTETPNSF